MSAIANVVRDARQRFSGKDIALPDIYERAVTLIRDTITLDESKYWVDKSEALCAWAQMYHDNQVGVAAKRLRLHAYRRMGQLAMEIQPTKTVNGGGRTPGPVALLKKSGLSRHGASAAVKLGKASEQETMALIKSKNPISPTTYERSSYARPSALAVFRNGQRTPFSCRVFCRKVSPKEAVGKMGPLEKQGAVQQMRKLAAWIDEFICLCEPTEGAE